MKLGLKSWVAVIAALTLTATSCSSDEKGGPPSEGTQSGEKPSVLRIKDKGLTAKGGTVYILNAQDFDSLDPANNYVADSQTVGRLIYRTLTFIDDTPGEEPSIKPDLAESLGTPSDDNRTWTYKLRPGLKYEDGRPITAQDIKYGIMRSFELDVFSLGSTFMSDLLANENDYGGPYSTPDKDLESVETPDERTLVLHFAAPQPDVDWIVSLFYTSPVPKDKDTRQEYGNRPIASGPYKIGNYTRDTSLTLVRNENWDPSTDPNRPAYPDRFEIALNVSKEAANNRLLADEGNDSYAVPLNSTLLPTNFNKLNDPAVGARFINGPGSCVNYTTINTQKVTDVDVRHAIALAIDRKGIQNLYGGEISGSIAESIIPLTIPGYVAPDLGLKPNGDPDAAKKLLEGKSVPTLHIAVSDDAVTAKKEATLTQANLQAVGLKAVIDTYPGDAIYTVIDSDDAPEISLAGGWCFDWPTPASIILPNLGPNPEGTSWGSNNAAKFFDPKYSAQIRELVNSDEDPSVINDKFVKLANEIQTTAWPFLPTTIENDPEVVGRNVTNVGISPIFTMVDLNTLAVKQ